MKKAKTPVKSDGKVGQADQFPEVEEWRLAITVLYQFAICATEFVSQHVCVES